METYKYKIYKLHDNTNGNNYIGITIRTLEERLKCHKKKSNSCMSINIIKNNDYTISLIEETNDKKRERYWIENTDNVINKVIPFTSQEESKKIYRSNIDNRKKEYQTYKLWVKKNKQSVKDWQKKYDKQRNLYEKSFGGSPYCNNNSLLHISMDVFM